MPTLCPHHGSTASRLAASLAAIGILLTGIPAAQESRLPVFRAGADLVVVDVSVRDSKGLPLRGLTPKNFRIYEDGQIQEIQLFSVEDILSEQAKPASTPVSAPRMIAAAGAQRPDSGELRAAAEKTPRPAPAAEDSEAPDTRNKRWIVLFFDVSSLSVSDLLRIQKSALEFVDRQMTTGDLVSIVQFQSVLSIKQDFTQDRALLRRKLEQLVLDPAAPAATAAPGAEASDAGADPNADVPEGQTDFVLDEAELNLFNSDRKLVAIETVADWLAPYPEMKALIHYSGGNAKTGAENQIQLRATIDAAAKANMAIYPVDARGLEAIPAGGDASRASTGSRSLFDGTAIRRQHSSLAESQETLHTLAADSGGRAFLDTNDLSQVYRQVQQDVQHYYILGYYSTNLRQDGKFRQIRVQIDSPGARVKHRRGYYAAKEFTLMTREERARQLEEAAAAPALSSELPLALSSSWFREAGGSCYVPVSLLFPAVNIPFLRSKGRNQTEFDFLAQVREEQGRLVSFVKDTVRIKLDDPAYASINRKNLQYDTGFFLKPGRYALKFLVRENQGGKIGSFEQSLEIPEYPGEGLEISPPVLGSLWSDLAAQPSSVSVTNDAEFKKLFRKDEKWQDPLVFNLRKLIPSVTRAFRNSETLYLLFDVYGASRGADSGKPSLLVSMTLWRGDQRISESPLTRIDRFENARAQIVRCRFPFPLHGFPPGAYLLQVNVIDQEAGKHAYFRQPLVIR